MKNYSILILSALSLVFSCSQPETGEHSRLNFGFEEKDSATGQPAQWFAGEQRDARYTFALDSTRKFKGKYALRAETQDSVTENSFGVYCWRTPLDYQGKTITLKARIRTEDVKGFASVILMTKSDDGVQNFSGKEETIFQGTQDWAEYTTEIAYPENLDELYIALRLMGSGKAWFDNIEVQIDGKDIRTLDSARFRHKAGKAENELPDSVISWKHPLRVSEQAKRQAMVERCTKMLSAPADSVIPDPSATIFPGAVDSAAARISRTIRVSHTPVPERLKHIANNLYYSGRGSNTMYSTGLYAAPGEIITVEIPENIKGKAGVQIGCHSDNLNWWMAKDEDWRRAPVIVRNDALSEKITRTASPFGGLIYITCPPDDPAFSADITIRNAVSAPYYILGKTTDAEWQKMLDETGAPWGELESGNIILTISTANLKKITDPAQRAQTWDVIVNACYDLAQIPTPYFRKQRIVSDVHIGGGAMHSGYPIMATHCPSAHMESEYSIADPGKLLSPANGGANWGFFHEIGHNMQNVKDWVFNGTTEVSVNLFTLYIFDHVLGGRNDAHEGISMQQTREMMNRYFANGAKFNQWTENPFLGLITFRQIQTDFGWEPFKAVFRRFHEENAKGNNRQYSDQEKINNFVTYFSEATQRNLMPFFKAWGIPVSESVSKAVAAYPEWMPYNFPPKIHQ